MKVLVIQTAFLGDAIISLSLAEELRRLSLHTHISYLVRPEAAPIMKLSPSVDEVLTFDKYGSEGGLYGIRSKAVELNAKGFDTVFTLHSSKRTMMLLERLNAAQKIGYGDSAVLTHRVMEIGEPYTAKAIRLLQVIFPEANIKALPRLTPREGVLPNTILKLPRPIITIASDSVWQTKQWGTGKYKTLLLQLKQANCSIILTGFNKSNDLTAAFNYSDNNIL